MDWRVVLLYQS